MQAIITCFYESRTKVVKTLLKGKNNKKWIVSNYYRHLTTHLNSKVQNNMFKKMQKNNSLKKYFLPVRQTINKVMNTTPSTTPEFPIIQSTSKETTEEISEKIIIIENDSSSEDVDDPSSMKFCDDKLSDFNTDDSIQDEV